MGRGLTAMVPSDVWRRGPLELEAQAVTKRAAAMTTARRAKYPDRVIDNPISP